MKRRYSLSMLVIALCALTGVMFAVPPQVQAQVEPPVTTEATRSVSVSGTGQSQVQPDMAMITLGVETQAEEASAALNQNNEQMQSLISTLTENGVAEEDIQTQAVQLQPQ
jgi:uncharacterized protein